MGLHDRPYMKDDEGGFYGGSGGGTVRRGLAFGMPKPPKAIKILLLINISVFILQHLFHVAFKINLAAYLGATLGGYWQVWRYVTFQFLHATDGIWHIALNMLGLYMLGTPLEQRWGSRRFVQFYLTCGVVAGLAYVVMVNLVGGMANIPLVGASGGVYGIVLACAVLFPHFKLIFFLFPVPIRLACAIIFGGMFFIILPVLTGREPPQPQFWSDVAHLGGAIAAACWVWIIPRVRSSWRQHDQARGEGAWKKKMQRLAEQQAEIDRILKKIHDHGIISLSAKEKKFLKKTTREQRNDR